MIGRSASQGFRAGSAAAFGTGPARFVHFLAAAFGLSVILAGSATAFLIVKTAGCIYLVYIGLSMVLTKVINRFPQPLNSISVPLRKKFYQVLQQEN